MTAGSPPSGSPHSEPQSAAQSTAQSTAQATAPPGRPVLRFAPSPNGWLHLGHALSALTSQAIAERLGGRFLLRIEDIDRARCRPAYVDGIFRDLEWLGLTWELPVWRQSERFPVYAAAALVFARYFVASVGFAR